MSYSPVRVERITSPRSCDFWALTAAPVTRDSVPPRSIRLMTIDSRSDGSTPTMTVRSAALAAAAPANSATTRLRFIAHLSRLEWWSVEYNKEQWLCQLSDRNEAF